jgi:hypothetical protein
MDTERTASILIGGVGAYAAPHDQSVERDRRSLGGLENLGDKLLKSENLSGVR